jgi:hypothetical protein
MLQMDFQLGIKRQVINEINKRGNFFLFSDAIVLMIYRKCWFLFCRCVGCLLIYSLGYAFRWKTIAIFAPAVPLLALISGLAAPESPVYLLSRRKTQEARKALARLYGPQYK